MIAESRAQRWQWALLLLTICLLALRFCHLSADFPVFHFYDQDGARYTDEGFYTGAALQHFTLGHAYPSGRLESRNIYASLAVSGRSGFPFHGN